jgi:DNA polymerase (family X)
MSNAEVAKLLNNIATAYSIKNESKFRFQIIAYQKAAESIASLNGEISEYFKEGSLELLPGVGPSIRSHLEELFSKGKVKHFDWVLKGIPKSVFVLTSIPTFGPKKAFRLAMEFNLKNEKSAIDDLLKAAKKGKIAVLEGFGEKSEKDVIRAIEEYREGKGKTTRMILPYAFEISEKVRQYLSKNKAVEHVEVLGSLRRRVSTIGDIDFAVATSDPVAVIEHFVNYPYKERIIEKGDISASIMVSGGKQIDLLIQPKEAFGSLLQHFTGSKNHNIHLREYALTKGLSLSEKGIKQIKNQSQLQQYSTEEEFYKALDMQWIPPEMREDTGEIELSIAGKTPVLIKPEDMKGDFHIHSSYPIEPSHDAGKNTPEEMLDKAEELGYEYLAFSEHNPSISRHTGRQIYEILVKRDKYLEQLKSRNKNVRIFKMLEVDILPNGRLALDDDQLELLDGAIVSVHSVFSMTKDAMTERILKALSHKKAKILAHPTGRLLTSRNGYDLDFDKIFGFCKKYNKALEINAWPQRLDLPDTIVKEAVLKGVKLVIDSDSHAKDQMDLLKYGVFVARRGWATKNDIINAMSYNQVADWFKR